jgi:hypothetical protein
LLTWNSIVTDYKKKVFNLRIDNGYF